VLAARELGVPAKAWYIDRQVLLYEDMPAAVDLATLAITSMLLRNAGSPWDAAGPPPAAYTVDRSVVSSLRTSCATSHGWPRWS
jgi:hypothetical protein